MKGDRLMNPDASLQGTTDGSNGNKNNVNQMAFADTRS